MTKSKKGSAHLNPWNNEQFVMEQLKMAYPNLQEPHLRRCFLVYMADKKKSESERRAFHKMLDEKPRTYKLSEYSELHEIKGMIIDNGIHVEEEVLLPTVKKSDTDNAQRFTLLEE